ncbi:MAG: Crp/Fnr family transcriptional regulator [Bacteroidales bacterium]|nr:Crp/Fnr family transcriptional regulator [Bacteroidales bacterium]
MITKIAQESDISNNNYCGTGPGIFQTLDKEQVQLVHTSRFEVDFKAGETIIKQGSALTHVIYLVNGKAKVLLEDSSNQDILLQILQQPDVIIGPGFNKDFRHYCSVVAIEDTKACFVDVNIFKNFVETNSQFALDLIVLLNSGYIKLYDKLKSLTNKHMNGRLADTLLYLSDDIYKNLEFETTLSRLDIANMSSMTKESVIRTLKNFKEDGIIDTQGDSFRILKKDVLLDISKKG